MSRYANSMMTPVWSRKLIHLDMDAFFAAVEVLDHPEYRGKPVVVGGNPEGRGVVSTCSYEARKFGIHSAMPAAHARRLCPQAVFLRPRIRRYREISEKVMAILRQHTPLVEQASLDEAYLDVTRCRFGMKDPVLIAKLIKQNIFAVTRLTASAGVAPNMFLAKVASDRDKPNGLTVVRPDQVEVFLRDLPVRKIPGVGPVTEAKLDELGIKICGQLAGLNRGFLEERFGKAGLFLFKRAHGMDDREVEPGGESKQLSSEETFSQDVRNVPWLEEKLKAFSEEVFRELQSEGRMGRTIVLKVKYFDFEQITRSQTLETLPKSWEAVYRVACELLRKKTLAGKKPIRLLGLGLSGLRDLKGSEKYPLQKDLFESLPAGQG